MTFTESPIDRSDEMRDERDVVDLPVQPAALGDVIDNVADESATTGLARHIVRTSVAMLAFCALALVFHLAVLSRLEHYVSQTRAHDRLRSELSSGTAPCPGCAGVPTRVYPDGTPLALLRIPSIGLDQAVVEGTSSEALTTGPGHLRDSVYPGQQGTSEILGRRAAYGGPFASIDHLRKGAKVLVTIGYGRFTYDVLDVRRAGQLEPSAPPIGTGRLILVTSTGPPFLPEGLVYIDAQLAGKAVAAPSDLPTAVPAGQLALGTDTGHAWALAFYLEGLIVASIAAVFCWRRWGRAQTWIVFTPVTAVLLYFTCDQIVRILPNLL